jgi:uncharacterized protein (TIGR02145 family)
MIDFPLILNADNRPEIAIDRAADPLLNAVLLSLHVKRGSWFFNPDFGSRLHELKTTSNPDVALARQYVMESLAWMIEAALTTGIEVRVAPERGGRLHFWITLDGVQYEVPMPEVVEPVEPPDPPGPPPPPANPCAWYLDDPTAQDFYIYHATQFGCLSQIVNGTHPSIGRFLFPGRTIHLVTDVDMTMYTEWLPIGQNVGYPFRGNFDGGGHTIRNLNIDRPDTDFQGLFGVINGGEVRNVALTNVHLVGSSTIHGANGGLIGRADYATIRNCCVDGNVIAGDNIGLLCGIAELCSIYDCYTVGTVWATGEGGEGDAGALVGSTAESYVYNCYSIAKVEGRRFASLSSYLATMRDCAYLGLFIVSASNSANRISVYSRLGSLQNNVAFAGTLVNGNIVSGSLDGPDGLSIDSAEIMADGTIGGRFLPENGWTVANGKLPGLFGKTVDMPQYIIEGPRPHAITVQDDGNGHASANTYFAAPGEQITLSETPNVGHRLAGWQVISGGVLVWNDRFRMPANDVTIKAVFERVYTTTVQSYGNGYAYVNPYFAAPGEQVKLFAIPNNRYRLAEWQVISGGVSVVDDKFTMPENDVTVRAVFEEYIYIYAITVQSNGNGTASANVSSAVAGEQITLSARPNVGYRLAEWQVISGGVSVVDGKFTMPENAVTVRAVFEEYVPEAVPFTDERDNQTYRTVLMPDGKVWMAENFNYEIEDSWCYDNDPANGDIYGRLYTFNAAMEACPEGWHLPSQSEWDMLWQIIGWAIAGRTLKATSGWNNRDDGSSGNGTDDYGFSALPGGMGGSSIGSGCIDLYSRGYWWTSEPYWLWDGQPNYVYLRYDNDYLSGGSNNIACSVRYIKDD